jgi:hypothetical protein
MLIKAPEMAPAGTQQGSPPFRMVLKTLENRQKIGPDSRPSTVYVYSQPALLRAQTIG